MVVTTFLALLEMCKLRLLRIYQETAEGEILITARGEALKNMGDGATDSASVGEEIDREYQ